MNSQQRFEGQTFNKSYRFSVIGCRILFLGTNTGPFPMTRSPFMRYGHYRKSAVFVKETISKAINLFLSFLGFGILVQTHPTNDPTVFVLGIGILTDRRNSHGRFSAVHPHPPRRFRVRVRNLHSKSLFANDAGAAEYFCLENALPCSKKRP